MDDFYDFENALDSAIEKSEKLTDKQLAEQISSNSKLKGKEIIRLFPNRNDLLKFKKLNDIINGNESDDAKSKKLFSNFNDLSEIIMKILKENV